MAAAAPLKMSLHTMRLANACADTHVLIFGTHEQSLRKYAEIYERQAGTQTTTVVAQSTHVAFGSLALLVRTGLDALALMQRRSSHGQRAFLAGHEAPAR